MVRIGDVRLSVDDVVDTLDSGARKLRHDDDRRQSSGDSGHRHDVGGEREKRSHGDLVVQCEIPAESDHSHLPELGQGGHGRREFRVQPRGAKTLRIQRAAVLFELVDGSLFLPESLDDAHARDGFLDMLGEVGGPLLRGPCCGEKHRSHQEHHQPYCGDDGDSDESQQRREPRHDADREHELQERTRGHRHHREQTVDEL